MPYIPLSDLVENILVAVIWAIVIVLLIIRHMEVMGLRFNLEQMDDGMEFSYRLGVYGGTVKLIRDLDAKEPQLTRKIFGWECRFPVKYSNIEMREYIRDYTPTDMEGHSHSKDLLIFNEIVNRKNYGLISIGGQIFVYDNRDHQPY